MDNRDMMQYGYFQNMPGNMMYGNFGYQGPPGSLMNGIPYAPQGMNYGSSNLQNNMNGYDNGNNTLYEINNRLNSLETRVKVLEQRLANNNSYQDDGSMYML